MPSGAIASSEVEVEWQFDALDLRPVERWLAGRVGARETSAVDLDVVARARPAKRLVDTYMDSVDWRVTRAGFVLRVRRRATGGAPAEVTLKDRSAATEGLRRRLEVTEPLPGAGLDALGPDGPVGRRIRALVGSRALQPLFEVRTRRRPFLLSAGPDPVGEAALDETVIDVPGSAKPLRMQRVEVEVDPDWVDRLSPVVERLRSECGLQPATMSKFEAGLLGSGLSVPRGPDVGSTALSPGPSVAELAFVVLRRNMAQMLDREAGTRLGEDPEELHDMRVATRRMRAALDLFSDVLPARARNIRAELGWVADALGRVRDLDVQLQRVEEFASTPAHGSVGALKDLVELLERRRHVARAALVSCLESARYERLVTSFAAMLHRGPPRRMGPANVPALLAVPELVGARHDAVKKAAKRARRSGDPDDFHRLRIRGKRLRYAVEFVSELYGTPARTYTRAVTRLQDALGAMQDGRVAADQLHALALEEEDGLSRETVFVLGGLAERFRQESSAMTALVPRHLSALSGNRWRRLTSTMDHRRLEAAKLSGWPERGGRRPPTVAMTRASERGASERGAPERGAPEPGPNPEPGPEPGPGPNPGPGAGASGSRPGPNP